MPYLIYFIIFYIGAIFGSFYLVVSLRGLKNESIITPRSFCDSCHKPLKWYSLFPIFSYLFLKGKCASCHKKIPFLNLLIELLTGLCFLGSFLIYGYSLDTLVLILLFSLLIIVSITDFKALIILDGPIIVITLLLFIVYIFKFSIYELLFQISGGILVFVFFWGIKLFGDKVFKKESFGGGDIKLGIFIGLLLGFIRGVISFLITCIISLPFALIFTLFWKKKEVPFGPFLLVGAIITYIFALPIVNYLVTLLEI